MIDELIRFALEQLIAEGDRLGLQSCPAALDQMQKRMPVIDMICCLQAFERLPKNGQIVIVAQKIGQGMGLVGESIQ